MSAGRVTLEHVVEYDQGRDPLPGARAAVRDLLLAFARLLEPGFAPPDALCSEEEEGTHASGCGGGRASAAWGDEARGVTYEETWIEHAANDETDETWTVYGLAEGTALAIRRHDRDGGTCTLSVRGPARAALEIALAWTALARDAAMER